jgi:hypothetical protein
MPQKKAKPAQMKSAAMRRAGDWAYWHSIRAWKALPPEKRTNFLRVKVGLRATAL